jgi:hypothetical protein
MKTTTLLRKLGLVTIALLGLGAASANVIDNVTLNFQSGATWTGSVTFNDSYLGMLDSEGDLTGGSYNYNAHFDSTWWQGQYGNAGIGQNYYWSGLWTDWLVSGTSPYYIGLTWNPVASTFQGGVVFSDTGDPYTSGVIRYSDLLVGYSSNSVPDGGATALLMGLTLLGFGAVRRKLR